MVFRLQVYKPYENPAAPARVSGPARWPSKTCHSTYRRNLFGARGVSRRVSTPSPPRAEATCAHGLPRWPVPARGPCGAGVRSLPRPRRSVARCCTSGPRSRRPRPVSASEAFRAGSWWPAGQSTRLLATVTEPAQEVPARPPAPAHSCRPARQRTSRPRSQSPPRKHQQDRPRRHTVAGRRVVAHTGHGHRARPGSASRTDRTGTRLPAGESSHLLATVTEPAQRVPAIPPAPAYGCRPASRRTCWPRSQSPPSKYQEGRPRRHTVAGRRVVTHTGHGHRARPGGAVQAAHSSRRLVGVQALGPVAAFSVPASRGPACAGPQWPAPAALRTPRPRRSLRPPVCSRFSGQCPVRWCRRGTTASA